MKFIRKALPLLFLAGILMTLPTGCFIFRRKNHCGDCPAFRSQPKR